MDADATWNRIARHTPLALLLDLDGTLIPFGATPAEARPGPDVLQLLGDLAAAPGLKCAVVSGRERDSLADMVGGVPGLLLVAEHGMWRRRGGPWRATAAVDGQALDELESLLAPPVRGHPGALLERKTASLCIHYRQVRGAGVDAFLAATTALLSSWLAGHTEFELLEASRAIEVRVRQIHKGSAVDWVRDGEAGLVCVAIGDDVTDEDTFAALGPDDAAVLVAAEVRRRTVARWRLPDPPAVRAFLRALLVARAGGEIGELPLPIAVD